jgi:HAD superfamily hydrolase (TIGR01458 family)
MSGLHDKDLKTKCQTKGDKGTMDRKFKGVMFDIDGVLEFQGKAYPGAVELLEFLRKKGITIRILSNSTLKSRTVCTEKLNRHGFEVTEAEVITASWATALYLKTLKPKSCWVMLKGRGLDEFREFNMDDESPEYIVLGDYREDFKFENMNKALKLLLEGTRLIVMIPEKVDHSLGGVELTVGAYGKMLEDAAGINATYIGKPSTYMFDIALESMAIAHKRVLMVGDRVSTDIVGARQAGIPSALVKTGEFKPNDLEGDIQPDFIVDAVGDIKDFF